MYRANSGNGGGVHGALVEATKKRMNEGAKKTLKFEASGITCAGYAATGNVNRTGAYFSQLPL